MATRPVSVRIGPYDVGVRASLDHLNRVANWQGGHTPRGHFERDFLDIVIDPNLPPQQQAVTLWHEIAHMVYALTMHPHNEPSQKGEPKHDEETVIHGLIPLQVAVLRDNPALVAYLIDPQGSPHAVEHFVEPTGITGKGWPSNGSST